MKPRAIPLFLPALFCVLAMPVLAALPKDAPVRIRASGLDAGWVEGRIGTSKAGCTMVYLNAKTQAGYTSVALVAVDQMQQKQGSAWTDVAVKPLVAQESKPCRDAAND